MMAALCPVLNLPRLCQHVSRSCGQHTGLFTHIRHPGVAGPCWGSAASVLGCRSLFTHDTKAYIKLQEKELCVNPGFGILRATGTVDFHIKPTNVQEYPDADRAFITVYGVPSVSCQGITVECSGEQRNTLTVCAAPDSQSVYCEIMLPIKYDLDVKLMDEGRLRISGMESDEVNVSTDEGEVNTHGLKSHNIHITTQHGHITADGAMQGNIFINAKTTHFRAKRLQGLALDIEAQELNTEVQSSYMNQGQIKADTGTIKMNNLHGCTDLLIKRGTVLINGFHGQISGFVGAGRIEMQVTDVTGNSALHLKDGLMKLSVQENPRHNLEVIAPCLELSEEVRGVGVVSSSGNTEIFSITGPESETSVLRATVVHGKAEVQCQNWLSTLGIKLPGK